MHTLSTFRNPERHCNPDFTLANELNHQMRLWALLEIMHDVIVIVQLHIFILNSIKVSVQM